MNKMLEVLKQLQEDSAAARQAIDNDPHAVRRAAGAPPQATPKKKFDVSSWNLQSPDQRTVKSAAKPKVTAHLPPAPPIVNEPPATTTAVVPPVVQRFESPWERSARLDLTQPLQASNYRTVLARWRDDLPGNLPRAVMIAGIGCEESDVAEFVLRLGMLQARESGITLLVDAEDSRWLSNVLVAYDQPGLAEAFVEGIPAKHFLQPTHTDGLKLLPAGLLQDQPPRNSVAMARLLSDLKAEVNWTIISAADGSSAFASDLARACDAVYLLVRLGVATSLEAARVRHHLQETGARILGCIALDGEDRM